MDPPPPDPWPLLHSRFRDFSFFFRPPVVVHAAPGALVLRHGHPWRLGACGLMFAMGVGMTASYWLPDSSHESTDLIPISVVRVLGPVMGLFLAGAGVHALFNHRRIELDTKRGLLRLGFGRHPRTTVVELRTADCALSLEPIRGREDVSAALLLRRRDDSQYVRLASAKWRESLVPLFETLRPLFGPGAADHTVAETGALPLTPMRVSADRGRTHAIRYDQAAGTAVVHPAGMGLSAILILAALGVMFIAMGVGFAAPHACALIPVGFGVVLIVGSAYASRLGQTLDRRRGLTLRRGTKTEGAFPSTTVSAPDIAAVQLCALRRAGEHLHVGYAPIQLRSYTSYQINLVTARPPNGRIHLMSDSNRDRAMRTAQELSDFLQRPLLDHR